MKYTFKKLVDGDTSVYSRGVWQCFVTKSMSQGKCTLEYAKQIFPE